MSKSFSFPAPENPTKSGNFSLLFFANRSLLIVSLFLTLNLLSPIVLAETDNFDDFDFESEFDASVEKNPDPFESVNRVSFWVTDKTDYYVLRPVAIAYDFVLPEFASQAITNVFLNLMEIPTMANDLFQLKFKESAIDAGRFGINTTIGVLGLFDVATSFGLEKNFEDFGQTLGYWGVPTGPYIFIPFLGPSSFRDATGLIVDYFLKPKSYVEHIRTKNSINVTETIDRRARALKVEKVVFGDKYEFLREFYFNRREYLINDGLNDESSAEIFDDGINDNIFNDIDDP